MDTAPAAITIRPSRATQKGIVIREPLLEAKQKKQVEAEGLDDNEDPNYKRKGKKRKGKKKQNKASKEPTRDSTPSPLRPAKKEVAENKLKEEAWL